MNTRPVSIPHLVFGLIFLGAALVWAIGAGTDADAPDLALMAPAVLIGAGVVGLVGVVVNARRRDAVPDGPHTTPAYDEPASADDATTVITQEEDR
jgi:hypothetical protein